MTYDNPVIVRQNQTQNARELLKAKGYMQYINMYVFMIFVDLWVDYCSQGASKEIIKRFKTFDKVMQERILQSSMEVDGVVI